MTNNELTYLLDRMKQLCDQKLDIRMNFDFYPYPPEVEAAIEKLNRKMRLVELQLHNSGEMYVVEIHGYEEGYSSNYAYVEEYRADLMDDAAAALQQKEEAEYYVMEIGYTYKMMTPAEFEAFREEVAAYGESVPVADMRGADIEYIY